jgi:hypothetical protein
MHGGTDECEEEAVLSQEFPRETAAGTVVVPGDSDSYGGEEEAGAGYTAGAEAGAAGSGKEEAEELEHGGAARDSSVQVPTRGSKSVA